MFFEIGTPHKSIHQHYIYIQLNNPIPIPAPTSTWIEFYKPAATYAEQNSTMRHKVGVNKRDYNLYLLANLQNGRQICREASQRKLKNWLWHTLLK